MKTVFLNTQGLLEVVNVWNALLLNVIDTNSINCFKARIDNRMINQVTAKAIIKLNLVWVAVNNYYNIGYNIDIG
ncbi:hypothetical protein BpHYR1_012150 [Brachionus plicatilis]|uniref:Uncharacterized protein n=1 Tax=Brachionus plicatilis TaxID=10195 RepID=A0A3M7R965_BRAPC|nr:hypothetical protein BpHYR1_012150 [Brachionus plicatilis]